MRDIPIGISQIVQGGICVAADDGQKVYAVVRDQVAKGRRVVLSFSGVTRLTTAFLNAAIGQIYGEFTEEQVRMHLAPVRDADERQLRQLKLVVDRAKDFFRNPSASKAALRAITENDDDE